MHVPELRTASRGIERAAASMWREERMLLREGGDLSPLQLALVTDGSDRALAEHVRAGGADVIGLLAPDALESLVWAAEAGADHGYSALDALLTDAVEAACLDLPLAESCRVASLLLAEGISVVLARPETPSRSDVRLMLDAATTGNAAAVLGLRTRGWPALATAVRLLPEIGELSQLTVLGWPASRAARAELCDVVGRLCGEVVAVCGSARDMPVAELSPTAPVTLSLLTAAGTTVVINESARAEYESAQLTLVGRAARAVIRRSSLLISDTAGVREIQVDDPDEPVAVATAGLHAELAGDPSDAAGLAELLAAARLLELAAQSYESDAWVEA